MYPLQTCRWSFPATQGERRDITIDGYNLSKGDHVIGALGAIMHDPNNFKNPSEFNPERFLKNGRFKRDKKVCPFSTGLRKCLGKQLAQTELFVFAAYLVHSFEMTLIEGSLEPAKSNIMLMPEAYYIQFTDRQ